MKSDYSDKSLKAEQVKALVCVRECEAPGLGTWKVGDRIIDPKLIDQFKTNPNFQVSSTKESGEEDKQP